MALKQYEDFKVLLFEHIPVEKLQDKMKIVIVNYRYFISGGPERYLLNVKGLLEKEGHVVIPFSVKHNLNLKCEYDKYFLSSIGKGDVTYFSESNKVNLFEIFKFFSRMFYSFEARVKFKKLITDTKPDLVYVIHYLNKLSPSFIGVAKKFQIPVVQRISDYGHICANQLFYNYRLKSVCELCLKGSKINAIKYGCVYNSRFYSLIKVLALKIHEVIRITDKIDAFVVPSKFTISKLISFGLNSSKLYHIPTFYKSEDKEHKEFKIEYDNYALYVGRIEEEKGILTMVKAFEETSMALKIIGFSSNNYDNTVKEYLKGKVNRIEFLGKLPFDRVREYLSGCAFTISPSECYDNFPNSVIESFAYGKAVICTNIGSLREMVNHNKTGLLFEPKDHIRLREYSKYLFSNKSICKDMGKAGREWVESELTENLHYNSLISLFNGLTESHNSAAV